MTTETGTVATVIPDRNQYVFDDEGFDASFAKHSVWKVTFHVEVDDLTDFEKEAIEKKLDSEDQEKGVSFGSVKEAIDFLHSRIKRPSA